MRRVLGAAAVAVGFLFVQVAPASAAATITAKAVPTKPACFRDGSVEGYLNPHGATPRLILQRTVKGKWVDWKWYFDLEESTWNQPHRLAAAPDGVDGFYSVSFMVPGNRNTLHLRVRSNGGSVASNGVYVTPTCSR